MTQGHPSYTPPPKTATPTPATANPGTGLWNPPDTGYSEEAGGAFKAADASAFGTYNAQGVKVSNTLFQPAGMGCAGEENSFWPGLISGLSLLASGLVLYEWLKKNGGLQF